MKKRRFREMKLEKKKCKRKRNNFVFVPTMLYFWNFQRKKKSICGALARSQFTLMDFVEYVRHH